MKTPIEILREALQAARHPKEYHKALLDFYTAADAVTKEVVKQNDIQLDCVQRCSFCCYQNVNVSAHEVFLIVAFVSARFTAEQQDALNSRLKTFHDRVGGLSMTELESIRLACPFLVDGSCSVYSVRPMSCRTYHSCDRSVCQQHRDFPETVSEGLPQDTELHHTWEVIAKQFYECYTQAGFDSTELSLALSIRIAKANPALEKRWRDRKSALLNAIWASQ